MNQVLYSFSKQKEDQSKPKETLLDGAISWSEAGNKGRGIFARRRIAKGELVETAPIVLMSKKNVPDDGPPDGYVLEWRADTPGEEHAFVLGYISLYNHSSNPNIYCESDFENDVVTATAIKDIEPGEELTWDYNCEIWFEAE